MKTLEERAERIKKDWEEHQFKVFLEERNDSQPFDDYFMLEKQYDSVKSLEELPERFYACTYENLQPRLITKSQIEKDSLSFVFWSPEPRFDFALTEEIAGYILSLSEEDFTRIFEENYTSCWVPAKCIFPQVWARITDIGESDREDAITVFADVDRTAQVSESAFCIT